MVAGFSFCRLSLICRTTSDYCRKGCRCSQYSITFAPFHLSRIVVLQAIPVAFPCSAKPCYTYLQKSANCPQATERRYTCHTKVTGEITTQIDKGTDVNIAVEMLWHGFNHAYDTAVLVSRDADFCSVVKKLKTMGRNVELVLFDTSKNYAQELTDCVDNVVVLDDNDCQNCVFLYADTVLPSTEPAPEEIPDAACTLAEVS